MIAVKSDVITIMNVLMTDVQPVDTLVRIGKIIMQPMFALAVMAGIDKFLKVCSNSRPFSFLFFCTNINLI